MQLEHGSKSDVISSDEMRRFERDQFQKKESYFFMKNAGKQSFKFITRILKKKQSIIVLCGPGNNGGDGFVIAKHLKNTGYLTEVYILSNKRKYKGDALRALNDYKGKIRTISSLKIIKNALIVDALFGIGLRRDIKGKLIKIFNQIKKSNNMVVSIDIPSGISSDTGKIMGSAIKAHYTVTFHKKKTGTFYKFRQRV